MNERVVAEEDPILAFQREVRQNLDALGKAREFRMRSTQWLTESLPFRYSYNFLSCGRPIIQYPQDMVAVHELIWAVRPDVIIETGVAHGGSLIHSASALALLDYCDAVEGGMPLVPKASGRRVIGIDIEIRPHNREAIERHPLAHKITLVTGSSTSPIIINQIRDSVRVGDVALVLLDSNHTRAHVYDELSAYAPLVSPGSYCVVYDTIIEKLPPNQYPNRPWGPGNGPMTAVGEFLSTLSREVVLAQDGKRLSFEVDHALESKLMITVAPGGYLRRI
jgi:cephalosporin hydroxylase